MENPTLAEAKAAAFDVIRERAQIIDELNRATAPMQARLKEIEAKEAEVMQRIAQLEQSKAK